MGLNIRYIAAATALLALAAAACGGDDEPAMTDATGTPAATAGESRAPADGQATTTPAPDGDTATAEVELPDAGELLADIDRAMDAAGTWRLQALLTARDSGDDTAASITTVIEAARTGPGKNIVVTSSSVQAGAVSGTTSSENRIIDGTRYRRDPNNGEWTVSSTSATAEGLTVDAGVVNRMDPATATVSVATLSGEPVYRIAGTVPGEIAGETVEVMAGVEDKLVRRVLLEGAAPAANFGGLLPDTGEPIPQSVEARYFDHGRRMVIRVPPGAAGEPAGDTLTYLSTINPFTMQVPGDMRSGTRDQLTGENFDAPGGEALFISEEFVDPENDPTGFLDETALSLESYAERFASVILADEASDFEIVSNETFVTDSGLEARLVRFTQSEGEIRWAHLAYLHGDDVGFGASFGAFADRFAEIEEDILATFRTFDLVDS